MAKYVLLFTTRPASPDRDDEFNAFYDGTHVPEVLECAGVVSARRLRAVRPPAMAQILDESQQVQAPYLVLYEVETDDVNGVIEDAIARIQDGRIAPSDVMVIEQGGAFELMGRQTSQEPVASARTEAG